MSASCHLADAVAALELKLTEEDVTALNDHYAAASHDHIASERAAVDDPRRPEPTGERESGHLTTLRVSRGALVWVCAFGVLRFLSLCSHSP